MKIYIVTSGEYSNYGIDAVFTDKKLAQKYVNIHYESRIEEFESDDTEIIEEYLWISYNYKEDCVDYFNLTRYSDSPRVAESTIGRAFQFDMYPRFTPRLRDDIEKNGIKSELMLKIARDTFAAYLAEHETSREQLIKELEEKNRKFESMFKARFPFIGVTSSQIDI